MPALLQGCISHAGPVAHIPVHAVVRPRTQPSDAGGLWGVGSVHPTTQVRWGGARRSACSAGRTGRGALVCCASKGGGKSKGSGRNGRGDEEVEAFRAQLMRSFGGLPTNSKRSKTRADAAAAALADAEAEVEEEKVKEKKPDFMTRKPIYLPFDEARKWAQAMGMTDRDAWEDWAYNSRRNPYVPRDPEAVYADKGWVSWDDWLGIVHYMPFEEARTFVRARQFASIQVGSPALGCAGRRVYAPHCFNNRSGQPGPHRKEEYLWRKSFAIDHKDWFDACNDESILPKEIPRQPNYMYRTTGWVSFPDWLGIEEPELPSHDSMEQ